MLTHTFRHIPGIGLKSEKRLWEAGVTTWEAFGDGQRSLGLPPAKRAAIERHLAESKRAITDNPLYFYELLTANQHWRMFPHFRHKTLYLDIETTGLNESLDQITTIATYDGSEIRAYVNGENLERFGAEVDRYDLLVTYNGKTFDLPVIERFIGRKIVKAHIDLRYALRNLGFRGGLKSCEKQLGVERGDLDGVDGYFAVLLWHEYQATGSRKALDTLLAYNIADAVNLEALMVHAYNLSLRGTPFAESLRLAPPTRPVATPYQADRETIDRIKRKYRILEHCHDGYR